MDRYFVALLFVCVLCGCSSLPKTPPEVPGEERPAFTLFYTAWIKPEQGIATVKLRISSHPEWVNWMRFYAEPERHENFLYSGEAQREGDSLLWTPPADDAWIQYDVKIESRRTKVRKSLSQAMDKTAKAQVDSLSSGIESAFSKFQSGSFGDIFSGAGKLAQRGAGAASKKSGAMAAKAAKGGKGAAQMAKMATALKGVGVALGAFAAVAGVVALLVKMFTGLEKQVKEFFPNAQYKIVEAPARDFQEVLAGRADAHITSNVEAFKLVEKYPQLMVVPVDAPKARTPIAMLLPQADQVWINYVNTWIKLKEEAGFFDTLADKWQLTN